MENIVGKMRGQAAMEYLMTYGWALLVIVIVIAILISLNLFSAPQGCNFESSAFACGTPVVDTHGLLYLPLTNGNANDIKLVGVVCIADKSPNAPLAPASAGHGYFGNLTILRQSTYDLSNDTNMQPYCYKADGVTKFESNAGADFSGKVWVFYHNDEDGANYPIRTISATLSTKTVKAN